MTKGKTIRRTPRPKSLHRVAACGLAMIAGGCIARNTPPAPAGIDSVDPWFIAGIHGFAYTSAHYRICTTVRDPAFLSRFVRLMEAAHAQYARRYAAPEIRSGPLEIDLLANANDFRALTAAIAGSDAAAYLHVGNGGYTIGERFVCQYGDEGALFSVASHEGLHQYMARHFRTRLPPSIEEGLATTFETVTVHDSAVTFDFDHNPRRRLAIDPRVSLPSLFPVDILLQMNAGDLSGSGKSETFYGESWVLARMLTTDERYRGGFAAFAQACATGEAMRFREPRNSPTAYRPREVWPALQPYLRIDTRVFEVDYGKFLRSAGNASP